MIIMKRDAGDLSLVASRPGAGDISRGQEAGSSIHTVSIIITGFCYCWIFVIIGTDILLDSPQTCRRELV